jgi:hypothetical protein
VWLFVAQVLLLSLTLLSPGRQGNHPYS